MKDIICIRNKRGEPLVLGVRHEKVYHSPDGFEWGYGGSGPAELALNILLGFTDEKNAFLHHQHFKDKFITTLQYKGGIIRAADITRYLEDNFVPLKKQEPKTTVS